MSISAISSLLNTQTQSVKQAAQTAQTTSVSAEVGAAATLELSEAATAAAASTTAASGSTAAAAGGSSATGQAGGSGGATSASCPLGNKSCTGCGQCGKLVSGVSDKNAQSGLAAATTDGNKNYQTTVATEAYDANSAYL